jgi:hypothetical protein
MTTGTGDLVDRLLLQIGQTTLQILDLGDGHRLSAQLLS